MNDVFASYSYSLYSSGPNYGASPKFYHKDKLPKQGFTSLYSVSHETAYAIEQAGTTKSFKGVVWSERLWIDVDSYEQADKVEEKLNALHLDYISFDTGGRGAHFGVKRDSGPSHLLPLQDKAWVREHFPEADASIYTHLHPFRLPGTAHQRTGRHKSQVGERAGKALILPPFTETKVVAGGGLLGASTNTESIFDNFFIQRNSEKAGEGSRHQQMIRLMYALRDAGYNIDIARWWVNEANKRWQPPKEEAEIEKALQSVYR